MLKVISLILGGGAGTRLHPLTSQRSKPAVPIGAKYRLIDIPISNCLNSGIKRMFVLTQYNSASLNQHIKNTYQFDAFGHGFVDILAAEQTPSSDKWFQGTADAVRQCEHHLSSHAHDYVLILSGDQLYQMDLEQFCQQHAQSGAELSIATIPVDAEDAPGFGIMKVRQDGIIERFIEKPKSELLPDWTSPVAEKHERSGLHYLASMGIYVFKREFLERMLNENPDAVDFGKEIIPRAIEQGYRVASYAYDGYWTDIGTIRSFYEANIALTDDLPDFNLFDTSRRLYTHARMLAPTKISGTTFSRSIVAEGSIILADKIDRSVVGIRARIGKGTVISNTVIMGADYYQPIEEIYHSKPNPLMGIGTNCHIREAIIDKNVCIGNHVHIQGHPSLPDTDTDTYCVRDGIIVVRKNAVIPDGTRIGV